MENVPPRIFDRRLLRQRKARAALGMERVSFLLEHVAVDLAERLSLMQRRFAIGFDLGAHGNLLSEHLLRTGKIDRLFRAAITPELCDRQDGSAFVCDEEALAIAPGSLDLVVSGLGLQLVNDLPGTLAQIRQALKPDGLLLAAMLGGRTLDELRTAFASAEIALTGGLSPRVAPFADIRDLGALLQRAGFALPVTDTDVVCVTYATPHDLMTDLKAFGAGNVLTERRRVPLRRTVLEAASQAYQRDFALADGRVYATFEVITLTGWAPHEGQQKPLRPGSALASLQTAVEVARGSAEGNLERRGNLADE